MDRKYCGDVIYEVWRSGGNPDAVSADDMDDHYYDGLDAEAAAREELRCQRPNPPCAFCGGPLPCGCRIDP